MKGLWSALALTFASFVPLHRAQDYSQVNSLLSTLELQLLVGGGDPIEVQVSVNGILLPVQIQLDGDTPVNCTGIGFNETFQQVGVFGEQIQGTDEYVAGLSLNGLQLNCELSLVLVLGNENPNFGRLEFDAISGLSLEQEISFFSPDLILTPPQGYNVGSCLLGVGELMTFEGQDLGEFLGADITELVLDTLRGDASLVGGALQDILCELIADLMDLLGDLIVNNVLTESPNTLLVENLFSGDSPIALQAEADILADTSLNLDLMDLSDQGNILVGFLVAGSEEEAARTESFLYGILPGLLDTSGSSLPDTVDPLFQILDSLLELGLEEEDGFVILEGLELIELLAGDILDENGHITIELEVDIEGIDLVLGVAITDLRILIDAPNPEEGEFLLPSLYAPGKHTLQLPDISLDSLRLEVGAGLSVAIDAPGIIPDIDFNLSYTLDETFTAAVNVNQLLIDAAILIPLDLITTNDLNLGPLLEALLDCLLSIFKPGLEITAVELLASYSGEVAGMQDVVMFLLVDIIYVALDIYGSVLSAGINTLLYGVYEGLELIESTECPVEELTDVNDVIEVSPFDFGLPLIQDLIGIVNADLINSLLGGLGDLDLAGLFGGAIELPLELPQQTGQPPLNLNIVIPTLALRSLGLPATNFTDVTLLSPRVGHEYAPQYLDNRLELESRLNGVDAVTIAVGINVEVFIDGQLTETNRLDLELSLGGLQLAIDLLIRISDYDMRSMRVGDLLNFDCWGGILEYPSGIPSLVGILSDLVINFGCDCENEILTNLAAAWNTPQAWQDLSDALNDLVSGLGVLLFPTLNEEEFAEAKEASEHICLGTTGAPTVFEEHEEEPLDRNSFSDKLTEISVYLILFAIALFGLPIVIMIYEAMHPHTLLAKASAIKRRNSKLKRKASKDGKESETTPEVDDREHLTTSLANNPLLPSCAKYVVPLLLVGNIGMFLYGDLGDAVQIDIQADILEIPLYLEDFATLSVWSSIRELWNVDAFFLAGVLFSLSIFWPYLKLFLLIVTWFMPPRFLSVGARGTIILWLDILGPYSFSEFYYFVVLLAVFSLSGKTPITTFLVDDLVTFDFLLIPFVALIVFASAVLLSIIISNVFLLWSRQIDHHSVRVDRKTETKGDLEAIDSAKRSVSSWKFSVLSSEAKREYFVKLTPVGVALLGLVVIAAASCIIVATFTPVILLNMGGLLGELSALGDRGATTDISVIGVVRLALDIYGGEPVVLIAGVVFVATTLIAPLVLITTELVMLLKPFTLESARKVAEFHHIIRIWSAIDVLVIATILSVLETPTVAQGLARQAGCDELQPLLDALLVPLGVLTVDGAAQGCLDLEMFIAPGGFVAVGAVFLLGITNWVIGSMFEGYVTEREFHHKLVEDPEVVAGVGERKVHFIHSVFSAVGLVKVIDANEGSTETVKPAEEEKAVNVKVADEDASI